MDAKDCEQYNTDHTCCTCKNGLWYELKAENERLKEEVIYQKKINQELIIKYVKPYAEPTLNTELFDKNYKLSQTLQEIKEIAERILTNNEFVYQNHSDIRQIVRLITKAESEEVE